MSYYNNPIAQSPESVVAAPRFSPPFTLEASLRRHTPLLTVLLLDRSRPKSYGFHNIIWATDSYPGHRAQDELALVDLVNVNTRLIQPRGICNSLSVAATSKGGAANLPQAAHLHDKNEVFTSSHIVQRMNSQLDQSSSHWPVTAENWQDYVSELRLEIACGEAPFVVNRYDANTSDKITHLSERVGFLDHKLQVVSRFCHTVPEWTKWARRAYQASYGYEWRGNSLFLARENLLYTYLDYWNYQFPNQAINLRLPLSPQSRQQLIDIAEVISWNFFQMDGLKYVTPLSCSQTCLGCHTHDRAQHDGIYAQIMDWETGRVIKFIDILHPS